MNPGRIALVTGRPNSGKTAYLSALLQRAQRLGKSTGGVLSHGLWIHGDKRGFEVEIVASGEKHVLAGTDLQGTDTLRYGRFIFAAPVFERAVEALQESTGKEVVVVDEYGPLEQRDAGLWPGIAHLLRHHDGCLLISVRPALVHELVQRIRTGGQAP